MSLAALLLPGFCILCYTIQNFFSKMYSLSYQGPGAAASPVFSTVYGLLIGAATLAYNGFRFSPGNATLLLGLANGVVLFLYNLSSINAARTGPFAFQSITQLFGNILLPLLFSTLWWGDPLSPLQIAGIGVMLAAFVLFNLHGLRFDGVRKGYYLWIILLFLANGVYGILVDAQQRVVMQAERNEMIITTFVTSAVISLLYLAVTQRKRLPASFRMSRRAWFFAVGSSVGAAFAINLLMLTLRFVPVSLLYTINNGGILILSTLLSAVVLHEKLTKNRIAGIGVATGALVLLCL